MFTRRERAAIHRVISELQIRAKIDATFELNLDNYHVFFILECRETYMISISIEDHGKVIVLNIEGEFYIENIEEAERIWNEQLSKLPKVIAINCKKISFIDSSAVGMLVKFLHIALKKNIELIFFDPNDIIIGVFQTAKLANFYKIMSRTQFEMKYLEA